MGVDPTNHPKIGKNMENQKHGGFNGKTIGTPWENGDLPSGFYVYIANWKITIFNG